MASPDKALLDRIARTERHVAMLRLQVASLQARLDGQGAPGAETHEVAASVTEIETSQTDQAELASAPHAPVEAGEPHEPVHTVPTAPVPSAEPTREPPAPTKPVSLERRVGGQVFAIAGALIVIIGLALAAKLAYDAGWFGLMPPAVRCLGIAGFGVVLLGAGEFMRTRVRSFAVAGCNAAGIGALYVAAFAAYSVFSLISVPAAFVLMAAASVVGLAVAMRHGYLSTALLALIGAYLVPVLLASPDASPYVLPVYLTLLSAGALLLAAVRPYPFGRLRDLAWLGTGLLGLVWTIDMMDDIPGAVLLFWAVVWSLHQGELLVSAARGALTEGDKPKRLLSRFRFEPVVVSVATTTGVVAFTTVVLHAHTALPSWLSPAALFAVTSVLGMIFGGHLRLLRDKPVTGLEILAAAHITQAAALLIVTVALAFGGWAEVTAWIALGLGAVVAGRWIGARTLDVYGILLLGIATVRLLTYDLLFGSVSRPWIVSEGVVVAPWTVLVLSAGAAWLAVARLLLHTVGDAEEEHPVASRARPRMAVAAAGLGVLLFAASPAHPDAAPLAVCLVWLAISVSLRAVARIEPRLHLDLFAAALACMAIGPWLLAAPPLDWLNDAGTPGTHRGLLLAAAIVAVVSAHAWAGSRWSSWTSLGRPVQEWVRTLLSIAAGVVFVASSIEIARSASLLADDETARRAAISIWWGLWGVALVVGGFMRRWSPVRYVGLGLIAIAAMKAVVIDLAGVPPIWRVASFVGLGALMLGVAVLYGRVSEALGDAQKGDFSPNETDDDAGGSMLG